MTWSSRHDAVDERFVRALYDEHGGALMAYAASITHDRQAAEDVVQETVVRAWRHADRLDRDGRPLRPWLMRVAHNLAVDRLRRAAAGPVPVPHGALEGIAGAGDVDRALDAWQLASALGRLDPAHRETLVELYFRGRSVAEAAGVLGIPDGTVKSRAYYALRTLKLILEEQGWNRDDLG